LVLPPNAISKSGNTKKAIKGRRTTHTHIFWWLRWARSLMGFCSSGAAWPGFCLGACEHGYIVVCLNVFHLPAMLCNFIDRCGGGTVALHTLPMEYPAARRAAVAASGGGGARPGGGKSVTALAARRSRECYTLLQHLAAAPPIRNSRAPHHSIHTTRYTNRNHHATSCHSSILGFA